MNHISTEISHISMKISDHLRTGSLPCGRRAYTTAKPTRQSQTTCFIAWWHATTEWSKKVSHLYFYYNFKK